MAKKLKVEQKEIEDKKIIVDPTKQTKKNKTITNKMERWLTVADTGEEFPWNSSKYVPPHWVADEDIDDIYNFSREKRLEAIKAHFSTQYASIIRTSSATKTGSGFSCTFVFNSMNDGLGANIVLDLGCGNNVMKPYIKNLIGVDILPWNGNTDVVADVLDYLKTVQNNTIDGIRCVGPLNFGTDDEIEELVFEIARVLSPGGLVCAHARPGRSSDKVAFNRRGMIHYPWTRDQIKILGDMVQLELCEPHLSAPNLNKPIITEVTDIKQLSWPQLAEYMGKYDEKNVNDYIKTLNEHKENVIHDMLDPEEEMEFFYEIVVKCINEYHRRIHDSRYDPNISHGVRPRYNWWWRKPK